MEQVTDKPSGSIIEEEVDSEGVTLRWWPPAAGLTQYAFGALYAGFFCVWAAACFGAAASVLFQPISAYSCCFIIVLGVLVYAGACLGYGAWFMLCPDRPESVRLEADWLRYNPGRSKMRAYQALFERRIPKEESPRTPLMPNPVEARRAEIRGLALGRVGKWQRLTFQCGAKRVEIGAILREPKREWLYSVLQRWLVPNQPWQQTGPAARLPEV
jgi:hypothetical protein